MYCSFDFALYSGHGNFELELKEVNEFLAKLEVPSWQNATRTTGKSLSEALIFVSNNPQYDNRLFIELQVQYMKIPSSKHGENMLCIEIDLDIHNNLCTQHVLQK